MARFTPRGLPRGAVVFSPGRTEPIEKYGEVARDLVARGFVVVLHDWAGQGCSTRFLDDPLRGDVVGGCGAFLSDFADVVASQTEHLPRPWIAMGHSMGAALTTLALSDGIAHFDGAVLCAPMMEFSTGSIPVWLARPVVAVAVALGRGTNLARKQSDPLGVPFEDNVLTHDRARYEKALALYRAHPELRLGEPTWRWLKFGLELRGRLSEAFAAERLSCPVSVVAAGDDHVVNNGPIRRFAARLKDGTYAEVPSAFHEILMEVDGYRSQFWTVFDRLAARVAPRG